mgnify:CR=1 FL=1
MIVSEIQMKKLANKYSHEYLATLIFETLHVNEFIHIDDKRYTKVKEICIKGYMNLTKKQLITILWNNDVRLDIEGGDL